MKIRNTLIITITLCVAIIASYYAGCINGGQTAEAGTQIIATTAQEQLQMYGQDLTVKIFKAERDSLGVVKDGCCESELANFLNKRHDKIVQVKTVYSNSRADIMMSAEVYYIPQ